MIYQLQGYLTSFYFFFRDIYVLMDFIITGKL